jgi:hypothetical protein
LSLPETRPGLKLLHLQDSAVRGRVTLGVLFRSGQDLRVNGIPLDVSNCNLGGHHGQAATQLIPTVRAEKLPHHAPVKWTQNGQTGEVQHPVVQKSRSGKCAPEYGCRRHMSPNAVSGQRAGL